jgi:ABC-type transport system involved in multi-copper enzyme maturation permease subunit
MNSSFAIAAVVIKESYRRKDFYVLFVLTAVLTIALGSANFFNDHSIVRYLKEVCLLFVWIAALVIAVTTAARQIPAERESRTIFPLLAKPVSRWDVMLGKFFGCWAASGFALVVFYTFFIVISGLREHSFPLAQYFQAAWLHFIFIGIVVAMVLCGSVLLSAPSSNATISFVIILGILLLGRDLNRIAMTQPPAIGFILSMIYYVMPHLEFFDVRDLIVHEAPLIAWWAWAAATLYGLLYMAAFLVFGWIRFRRLSLQAA